MSHTEYSAQFVQYSSVFLGLEEALLLLSRLITIQSAPNPLQPEHLEQLFIQDYFYLQDLYHQLHPYGFYDQERLYEEISFIAFYFHWNLEDILQFTHSDRRRWVEQISKLSNAS